MHLLERRVFRGPSLYAHFPVIRLTVDLGPLEEWPSARIPGFNDKLLAALPSLRTHTCSHGAEGGFIRRLTEDEFLALAYWQERALPVVASNRTLPPFTCGIAVGPSANISCTWPPSRAAFSSRRSTSPWLRAGSPRHRNKEIQMEE